MNVNNYTNSAENIDPDSNNDGFIPPWGSSDPPADTPRDGGESDDRELDGGTIDTKHDPAPARSFPIDAMPDPIQRFVGEIARVKSLHPLMVLVPTLAVLSGATGNARRLRLRSDYYAPAVLWPVLVASSGAGKSPAFREAMRPLYEIQADASKQYDAELFAHREAMSERKSKPKNERGSEPIAPTLAHHYLSDTTVEAIGTRLLDTPRGLLVAVDEFAGLVGSFGQFKAGRGNDRETWMSFYDAGPAKIDRKTSIPPTIHIPRAFIAATGTIQPAILRSMLDPSMIGCGFAARLLLAAPPRPPRLWIDDDPDADVVARYGHIVRALRSIDHDPDHPRHVTPSSASMNLWRDWVAETESMFMAADGDAMRAAIPKLCDVAARLALIYHLVDAVDDAPGIYPDRLDERSMAAGIECARWFIGEAERIYDLLDEAEPESDQRKLIELIRRNGGSITARGLRDRSRRYQPTDVATDALDGLVRAGAATIETATTGGRPATIYRLTG